MALQTRLSRCRVPADISVAAPELTIKSCAEEAGGSKAQPDNKWKRTRGGGNSFSAMAAAAPVQTRQRTSGFDRRAAPSQDEETADATRQRTPHRSRARLGAKQGRRQLTRLPLKSNSVASMIAPRVSECESAVTELSN